MTSILRGFTSPIHHYLARKVFVAAAGILALVLTSAGLALGQACDASHLGDTCPVAGTVGFETGLQGLAFLKVNKSWETSVTWGDGVHSPALLRCYEPRLHPHQCHVYGTHVYKVAGTYTVAISYVPPGFRAKRQRVTTTATIDPVGDFVILSIGDSVASGEGDPVVQYGGLEGSKPHQGFWDDPGSDYDNKSDPGDSDEEVEFKRACHRSTYAGPAQAADLLARTNPITVVHFACSGATITAVPKNVSNLVAQLRIARRHLPRIDALLISGGANNMTFRKPDGLIGLGFGSVILRCLKPFDSCSDDPNFAVDISDSINGNPDRVLTGKTSKDGDEHDFHFPGLARMYSDLDKEIHCINPDNDTHEPGCIDPDNQIPKLVLLTEYFDPTHDETGEFPRVGCLDGGITKSEWMFLFNNVVVPLNTQVQNSPWNGVNIQNDFLKHGYCAGDERWVNTAPDSIVDQNDQNGTAHPNRTGQGDYRSRIYDSLVALNPPVTTATATAGDSSYQFGTWTNQDVAVKLSATNGIKESGVGTKYYDVDDSNCTPDVPAETCSQYSAPFSLTTPGIHAVTYFSANSHGGVEAQHSAEVLIDKNPPLSATPGQQVIHSGSAVYQVTVGHVGWPNLTVNLSCKTEAGLACTMNPTSVSLSPGDPNNSIATVSMTSVAAALQLPAQPTLLGPVAVLRIFATLATAVFLLLLMLGIRRRWAHGSSYAALAVLLGLFCASCGDSSPRSGAGQGGVPPGSYDVQITGLSGDTTNTTHAIVVVP